MDTNLRFHWMLPKGGEAAMKTAQETSRVRTTERTSPAALPDMEGWVEFSRRAEESGIESVLLSFSRYEPDTILTACAVGRATTKLKFIVAYRMGLMQSTTFVQQINTLSGLIGGRVALNIVAGSSTEEQHGYGDFLEHDGRYVRAEECLAICHSFWRHEGDTLTSKVSTVGSRVEGCTRRSSRRIEVLQKSTSPDTPSRRNGWLSLVVPAGYA